MSENPQAAETPGTTPPPRRAGPSFFFPLLLILVGVVLFLNTTNLLPWYVWWRLWVLWPAIFILIGIDILLRRAPALLRLLAAVVVVVLLVGAAFLLVRGVVPETPRTVQAQWPLAELRRGEVTLNLGAGQMTVEPLGDSANWAEVDLSGMTQEPRSRQEGGVGYLDISQESWGGPPPQWQGETRWQVRLNSRLPLNLEARMGAGDATLNLGRLNVTDLTLDMGVGQFRVTLPGGGEAGTVQVHVHAGVGSIHLVIPEGVAAQIDIDSGLGGADVDESRFHKTGDVYRSANYEGAQYRLNVEVDVGIGSIEVK